MNENGKAPGANGQAYDVIDHEFDVVVIGAGGAGLRTTLAAHSLHNQGFPNAVAHRCGPGRYFSRSWKHGPG